MKQVEILNEIEKILKGNLTAEDSVDELDDVSGKKKKSRKKGPVKAIFNLLISFLMSVIKAPFQLIQVYIKNEIVAVIRKELKLYFIIIILFGVLFTIFITFWVLISLAIGAYFVDQGETFLTSVLYVLGFQLLSFAIIGFVFYKTSGKIKSLKLLRFPKN